MPITRSRIPTPGLLFCTALAIEAFGVVAFLRIEPDTGVLSIRAIGPYTLIMAWALLKALQGLGAYAWAKHAAR